jgi:hypothetical protein
MSGIVYKVDIPQLPALQKAFAQAPALTRQAVATALNKSLTGYQATAKQLAPIDTGDLRSRIALYPGSWSGNTIRGSVAAEAPHSIWQEAGTGIYGPRHTPITPKTKSTLAWFSGGQWHFAKSVKGSKPRWFMRGSVEQNQTRTDQHFQRALDDVVGQIGRTA